MLALEQETVSARLMRVTPSVAREMLARGYPGQRPLDQSFVAYLQGEMVAGRFLPGQLVFAALTGDDHGYLVDGQHRLSAMVAANIEYDMVVITHQCRTMEDVSGCYRRLDRGKGRGVLTILRDPGVQSEMGISGNHELRIAVAAVPHLLVGFRRDPNGRLAETRSLDVRVAGIREWAGSIRAYGQAIHGASHQFRSLLLSGPISSVALVTFRYRAHQAQEFWRPVALNDSLKPGTPAHTMARFITDNRVRERGVLYYTRAVASAWNAHYLGKNLQRTVVHDTSTPIKIEGTPYDGERVIASIY